jgi:hypothetical protein
MSTVGVDVGGGVVRNAQAVRRKNMEGAESETNVSSI